MPDITPQLEQLARTLKEMDETVIVINGTTGWRSNYTSQEIFAIERDLDRIRDMLDKVKFRLAFLIPYYRSNTIGTDSNFPIHRQRLRAQIQYIQPYIDVVASKTIGRSGETIADL